MLKTKSYQIHKLAGKAMRKAVEKVVIEHKKTGRPLAVWKDDKVVRVPAARVKNF